MRLTCSQRLTEADMLIRADRGCHFTLDWQEITFWFRLRQVFLQKSGQKGVKVHLVQHILTPYKRYLPAVQPLTYSSFNRYLPRSIVTDRSVQARSNFVTSPFKPRSVLQSVLNAFVRMLLQCYWPLWTRLYGCLNRFLLTLPWCIDMFERSPIDL